MEYPKAMGNLLGIYSKILYIKITNKIPEFYHNRIYIDVHRKMVIRYNNKKDMKKARKIYKI